MSSGSDDEDELLQMALKEQAQRDVSYSKPSSNSNSRRPVVNYVQPPKQAVAAGANRRPPPGAKGRKMSVDDDDDSEVEMLSISSGDEETTSKDRGGGGGGGGAAARARARSASGRDDDRAWDGEEPDCWKRVDEAELARRVREMRETRTAPVAQKFEKKASGTVRKGLNTLLSIPRGMECIDPLGLGYK